MSKGVIRVPGSGPVDGLDQGELGLTVFAGERTRERVPAHAVVVDVRHSKEVLRYVVEGTDDDDNQALRRVRWIGGSIGHGGTDRDQ